MYKKNGKFYESRRSYELSSSDAFKDDPPREDKFDWGRVGAILLFLLLILAGTLGGSLRGGS